MLDPTNLPRKSKGARTVTDLLGEHRLQMLEEAHNLSRMGATTAEIAEWFGVGPTTIYAWRARDPSFDDALNHFNEVANKRVISRLYDRAIGYRYMAEEIKVVDGRIVRVPVVKEVEPSLQAQIFWLKNRAPGEWKDKHEFEGEVSVTDKASDPRQLAMAIIAALRDATMTPAEEPATIEHQTEGEDV